MSLALARSERSDALLRRLTAAIVALLVVVATLPLAFATGDQAWQPLTTACEAIAAGIAAIACARAARLWHHDGRIGWSLATIAFLVTSMAAAIVVPNEVRHGGAFWSPMAIDIAYVIAYPLLYVAVIYFTRIARASSERIVMISDSVLVGLAISAVAWFFVILPAAGPMSDGDAAMAFAFLIGDILLIFAVCVVFIAGRFVTATMPLLLIAGALCAIVLADFWSSYVALANDLPGGFNPLWTLGYGCFALAAMFAAGRPLVDEGEREAGAEPVESAAHEAGPRRRTVVQRAAPVVAFPLALILLLFGLPRAAHEYRAAALAAIAGGILLLAAVMVRQFITLSYNSRMRVALERSAHELEAHVETRTAELTARTDLALDISQCDTLDEVLVTGLRGTLDIAGGSDGLAWIPDSDALYWQHTLPELTVAEQSRLQTLVNNFVRSNSLTTSVEPVLLDDASRATIADLLEAAGQTGRQAVLVPLRSQRHTTGMMLLFHETARRFSSGDYAVLRALGTQIGATAENIRQYEAALSRAERDSFTGMLNHHALLERLEVECHRAARAGSEVAVVMTDVDGFKLVNDTYGHPIGDVAIGVVARTIASSARTCDIVGRYGGDEFMVILPDTSTATALTFCRRLRERLEETPVVIGNGVSIPLSLSMGVAGYPADAAGATDLVAQADAGLYASKHRGGDCVSAFGAAPEAPDPSDELGILGSLVQAVNAKDRSTRAHSEKVGHYALLIAEQLHYPPELRNVLRITALLHDVGKIGVPDNLLRKPGQLNDDESEVLRGHVTLSEQILAEIPNLKSVIAAVASHHEHWDGSGYPRGLAGTAIPELGRVLAVADAWSAMTSNRPYRRALSHEQALAEIKAGSGSQFDPHVVEAFVAAMQDFD